jgi:hypothetical protein
MDSPTYDEADGWLECQSGEVERIETWEEAFTDMMANSYARNYNVFPIRTMLRERQACHQGVANCYKCRTRKEWQDAFRGWVCSDLLNIWILDEEGKWDAYLQWLPAEMLEDVSELIFVGAEKERGCWGELDPIE